MAEIGLQGSRIMPSIRQRKATGMSQHVWMHLQPDVRSLASALNHASKPCNGEWCAPLRQEYECRRRILFTLQLPQRSQLIALDWMR